tara:strand:- start:11850 stop:14786 length:2937 start_codon:yes stop_codon:yes gene_type:complete
MSVDKFKFVSPGIFIDEIDNSQLPNVPTTLGPAIIGRLPKGPGMRPIQVNSFSEFVEVFGNPVPGGQGGDIWRDGNYTAPTYASYAAQAWLKNNSPVTVVRLLGDQNIDATEAGLAGWKASENTPNVSSSANGGAFGLFIANSGSGDLGNAPLAAIFYIKTGSIRLIGEEVGPAGTSEVEGDATMVKSVGADYEFKAIIEDADGTPVLTSSFNLNRNSDKFIRKVFNTNPTLINSQITQEGQSGFGLDGITSPNNNLQTYFLGESFERWVHDALSPTTSSALEQYGVILSLENADVDGATFTYGSQAAETGWVISQDITTDTGSFAPTNMTNLFKLVARDTGEWDQSNLKISITNVQQSFNQDVDPYGTFSLEIRRAQDSDANPQVVERYTGLTLDRTSPKYIARQIGDMYQVWDDIERRYRVYGNYLNVSKYVRVEMNPDVEEGVTDARLLPFGHYGPVKYIDTSWNSGSALTGFVRGFGDVPQHFVGGTVSGPDAGSGGIYVGSEDITASFAFPDTPLRISSSNGGLRKETLAYWGVNSSLRADINRFDPGYGDYLRSRPLGLDSITADGTVTEHSYVFTLDDVAYVSSSDTGVSSTSAEWAVGNRVAGRSITSGYSSTCESDCSPSYTLVLDADFNRFTIPLYGGFNGLDIREKEPFRNSGMVGASETTDYAYNSIKKAIDVVADPEVVEYNILAVPGVTNTGLTDHMLNVCEERGDALAIIDLEGGFVPSTENNDGDASPDNRGSVSSTVSSIKSRKLNTSYGCAYYPWVQIRDSITSRLLWAPPSVVALGTMGSSEKKSALWFAPAGFTRGGLSEGSAGVPVLNVKDRLSSSDRDKLYEVNVNPIATFPAEGIVIFGQKTLQATPSALDRVNVRRLMIYLKKEISRMAATLLFDQNVERTWLRFTSQAVPFLENVKAGLGITEFRFLLDKTTTTPDLIDRNIMYAKIIVKPARAIEYIALDFVITNSGASFND